MMIFREVRIEFSTSLAKLRVVKPIQCRNLQRKISFGVSQGSTLGTMRNDTLHRCNTHAIQNQIFSITFLGFSSGHTTASIAALPVQISASSALTGLVLLKIFQNRYNEK